MLERYDFLEAKRTARIAGAMAHELNNPLQGLLSSLSAAAEDDVHETPLQDRMDLISRSAHRLSRAVESFSAMYENLPRVPDHLRLDEFRGALLESLSPYFILKEPVQGSNHEMGPYVITCYAAETIRLLRDTAVQSMSTAGALEIREITRFDSVEYQLLAADVLVNGNCWKPVEGCSGVAGLVVILDEIVRMCGGHTELACDDRKIAGIKMTFIAAELIE